jgi:hypothetical protein
MQLWTPAQGDKEEVINGRSSEIDLIGRAILVKQYNIIAGENLAIAQHRDTLRYARVRSGDYRPIEHKYHIGQYVFVKHKQVTALQPKARTGLYRIQDLKDNGVVILEGTDGATFKEHVEHLAPCHLPVQYIDAKTTDNTVPSEDMPCEVCRQTGREAEMILCDGCDTGWHMGCLNPSLTKVPDDEWFCPNCSLTEGKQSRFLKRIKGQAIATQWLDNRYIRPIMDAEGKQFEGLRVRKLINSASNRHGKHYYGTLQYLTNPADPALKGTFKVNFDDGGEEYNDWTGLQADKRLKFVDNETLLPVHDQTNPTLQPQDAPVAQIATPSLSQKKAAAPPPASQNAQPKLKATAEHHRPGAHRRHRAIHYTMEPHLPEAEQHVATEAGPHREQRITALSEPHLPEAAQHVATQAGPHREQRITALSEPHLPEEKQPSAARPHLPGEEHDHNAVNFTYAKPPAQGTHHTCRWDGVMPFHNAVHHTASALASSLDLPHASAKDLLFDNDGASSQQSSNAAVRQGMGVPPKMPAFWDTSQPCAWAQMLEILMPGSTWAKVTLTNKAKAAQLTAAPEDSKFAGQSVRHRTSASEIAALIPHIKWDALQRGFDAWSGDNAIKHALQEHDDTRHIRILTNDIDPGTRANGHKDALQPGHWEKWMRFWKPQFLICSPLFMMMDLAVPLMARFCPILFVHVPCTWVFSATETRSRWLQDLKDEGRLQIIANLPRGSAGPWRCCWLIILQHPEQRPEIMHNAADFTL